MANDFNIKVSTAIDSMRMGDLAQLERSGGTRGEARFSVSREGSLIVMTGPLKRDNVVVRFFKGLFDADYRARDQSVKLALNAGFQRRITEKAVSLFPSTGSGAPRQTQGRMDNYLKAALIRNQALLGGELNRTELTRAYTTSQRINNTMSWGDSLAWMETKDPSGVTISQQLDPAPQGRVYALRQAISAHVQRELMHDPKMAELLTTAGRELAERGNIQPQTQARISDLVQQKTAEVLQILWAASTGDTAEARINQMLDSLPDETRPTEIRPTESRPTETRPNLWNAGQPLTPMIHWNNRTTQNPTGVCEAAVTMWLGNLMEGQSVQTGVPQSPESCDDLQTLFMTPGGGGTNWVTTLSEKAKAVNAGPGKEFHVLFAGSGEDYTTVTLKGPDSVQGGFQALNLGNGEFAFLSASTGDNVGHAIGVFRQNDTYYVFDPNMGLLQTDSQNLPQLLAQRTSGWALVRASIGMIAQ